MNQGFGKDFYRKGNSVKRFGPFTEPPDSENWKVAVLIPFPKMGSYRSSSKMVPTLATEKLTRTFFFSELINGAKAKSALFCQCFHSQLGGTG